jgi:hypothetical protein
LVQQLRLQPQQLTSRSCTPKLGSSPLEKDFLHGALSKAALYNHQLPQSALQSKTPMQVMKQRYQTHPELFNKRPYDRPGTTPRHFRLQAYACSSFCHFSHA